MTVAQAIAAILQLAALFPTLEPAFVQAVKDFEALFANGAQPTQAYIDALIARVQAQSAEIQQQAAADAADGKETSAG